MMNMNKADGTCTQSLAQHANNGYAPVSMQGDTEVQAFYRQVKQRFLQQSARYLEKSGN